MNQKINWPNWVAVAGVILFAMQSSHAVPAAMAQGGLPIEDWGKLLLPLLALVPKLIDLFRRDKTEFTKMVVALAAIEDVRIYLAPTDVKTVDAVATLKTAILAKLDPPKAEVKL
jgi:hypothetical protein